MSWLSQILMGQRGHVSRDRNQGFGEGDATPDVPEAAVDPVSGETVRTGQALTSLYEGKVYYFASKENRERFEAAPQQYAHKASDHPAPAAHPAQHGARGHRCC